MMKLFFLAVILCTCSSALADPYPWLKSDRSAVKSLHEQVGVPKGFERMAVAPGSYGAWLRHLPMAPEGAPVRTFDGRVLDPHPLGVIALDVGSKDLQQCADTIIRLRAEYLRQANRADDIAFHFVSGDLARWRDYRQGRRPDFKARGKGPLKWTQPRRAQQGEKEKVWRGYLRLVFGYASTLSLAAYEKKPNVASAADIRPGDFFVIGGSPGHTVVVLDVAKNDEGDVRLLIGQGFMPAQSMHLVPNRDGGVWHKLDAANRLHIDAWPTPFGLKSLRSFSLKER